MVYSCALAVFHDACPQAAEADALLRTARAPHRHFVCERGGDISGESKIASFVARNAL